LVYIWIFFRKYPELEAMFPAPLPGGYEIRSAIALPPRSGVWANAADYGRSRGRTIGAAIRWPAIDTLR
jgi:hypothetical protein